MSTKDDYSTNAEQKKDEAEKDEDAEKAWKKSRKEHDRFIDKLDSVNINEYADQNHQVNPNNIGVRKLIVPSIKPGIDVVADFGGGYMRLQIRGTAVFLDKNWNVVEGKSLREAQRLTHFRIKKKEEM